MYTKGSGEDTMNRTASPRYSHNKNYNATVCGDHFRYNKGALTSDVWAPYI